VALCGAATAVSLPSGFCFYFRRSFSFSPPPTWSLALEIAITRVGSPSKRFDFFFFLARPNRPLVFECLSPHSNSLFGPPIRTPVIVYPPFFPVQNETDLETVLVLTKLAKFSSFPMGQTP